MAEIDAKRYKLIVEALEYKLRNRNNPLATRYKGWDYNGRNGIFWTARRNFPQVYNREHPQQATEGDLDFAEAIVKAHSLKQDAVLEKFFDEIEAPTLDPQTAAIVDLAIKQETPPAPPVNPTIAPQTPITHPTTPPTLPTPEPIPESFVPVTTNQPEPPSLGENLPRERLDQRPAERNPQTQRRFSFSRAFSAFKPVVKSAGSTLSVAGPPFKIMSTRIGKSALGMLGGMAGGAGGLLTGSGTPGTGGLLNSRFPGMGASGIGASLRSSTRSLAGKLGGNKKWLLILLLLLLVIFVITSAGGLLPSGGSITSCKFTNEDESLTVNSSRLQEIFQEVSAKSQIPSATLASLAMHTNKDFTSQAGNDDQAFSGALNDDNTGCKFFDNSNDGRLGLMQVKRDDPTDPSDEGLKIGANMMDKKLEDLKINDFCDIRTNVYLAAGILTAKAGGPPQKSDQINSSICSYFSSPFCTYGLLSLYNYGEEVVKDTESCQQNSSTVPPGGGGGSCPDQTAINANRQSPDTCHYFGLGVDLFNTNIPQAEVDKYINHYGTIFVGAGKGSLDEFKNRVNYIITSAGSAGLNPVLFLGYWKTESRFSTIGTRDLGCLGDNFYEQVDCALGVKAFSDPRKNPIANCARSKDAESPACKALKDVRKTLDQTNPIKYPVSTVDDFAEAHGSRFPDLDGVGKTNNNCVSTYNQLVEVAEELNSCHITNPPVISIPLNPGLTSILEWNKRIIDTLQKGVENAFNRLLTSITNGTYPTGTWAGTSDVNLYWCTYSIIDSYRLAGFSGLDKNLHASVLTMENFWKGPNAAGQGYIYKSYSDKIGSLNAVRPGWVIFMFKRPGESTGLEHVAMVTDINLNQPDPGWGYIDTRDSNSPNITHRFKVEDWIIRNLPFAGTANAYKVTGFGGI